jgi:hypothetical protein
MHARSSPLGLPSSSRAEYRFGLVLVLLLATFVLLMAGSTARWVRPTSVALTGGTLLAALLASDATQRVLRVAAVMVAIAVLTSLSLIGLGRSGTAVVGLLDAALVIVAPVAIARSVVRRHVIDTRTIMAALCIYVLFAMLWAFVYTAIGNFGSNPFFAQASHPTSADYLYFSFITQLTVGYGDLTAAHNIGRAGAVLEALFGQIYLVTVVAVLVSRLVPAAGAAPPSDDE